MRRCADPREENDGTKIKYQVLKPVGLNTIAFGLIIGIQQILVFPFLSRTVSVADFSSTVLLITLSTVFVNVIAGEASNVMLIRGGSYERLKLPWDAARLVGVGGILLALIAVGAAIFFRVPWEVTSQGVAITLLGMYRTFGVSPDKFHGRFILIVYIHIAYVFGAAIGLTLVSVSGSSYFPFLLAEVAATISTVFVRFKYRDVRLTIRRTREFSATRRSFLHLAVVALLVNTVSYLDRIMIVPLLGAAALGVYYATSALSKSLSLITNPVGNAFLARIGRISPNAQGPLFSKSARLAGPSVIIFAIFAYIVSFAGLAILYPDFYAEGRTILFPVALTAAFASSSDLMRPVIMRFIPAKRFLAFNVVYALVYIVSIAVLSYFWGLIGFAWASAFARASLFFIYLSQCVISGKEKNGDVREVSQTKA